MELSDWLRELPKLELHVHLEGSMSVDTVRALAERHGADPTPIWPHGLPERFSFAGFVDFSNQFIFGLSLLRDADDLATVVDDLAATYAALGVRYAEVTTTAFTHFRGGPGRRGMAHEEYRDGLDEGRRRARARGVELAWVIDIPRDLERPGEGITIDFLESGATPDGLVAIGLGGYEVGFPAAPFASDFARARALGLGSVPHAGETEGPDSVRSAVVDLGAQRVGHGVRSIEDPALIAELVERETMLEVSLTSNVLLKVVDELAHHPLPRLLDAGVRACLNTDDPGWFATDLLTELVLASEVFGLSAEDHRAMQLDALAASFASETTATELRTAIRDA